MQVRANENETGVFITLDMACALTNLGRNTVRKIAAECNAVRKIGKCMRINRQRFLEYLDTFEG